MSHLLEVCDLEQRFDVSPGFFDRLNILIAAKYSV
jgi:hypothetical protein